MLVHEKANATQGRGGVAGDDLAGKSKHPASTPHHRIRQALIARTSLEVRP